MFGMLRAVPNADLAVSGFEFRRGSQRVVTMHLLSEKLHRYKRDMENGFPYWRTHFAIKAFTIFPIFINIPPNPSYILIPSLGSR